MTKSLPAHNVTRNRYTAASMARDVELLRAAGMSPAAATSVIKALGSLPAVGTASQAELEAAGVPRATASKLRHAFMIGRRSVTHANDLAPAIAADPEDIFHILRDRIIGVQQELFFTIALNTRCHIIDVIEVARGTVSQVYVECREVFRPAIRCSATSIVIAHNHPSGDPSPSDDDIELTDRLRKAGELLGISIIDHIVFTPTKYRSISDWMGDRW